MIREPVPLDREKIINKHLFMNRIQSYPNQPTDDVLSVIEELVELKRNGKFEEAHRRYAELAHQEENDAHNYPYVLKSWAKILVCLGDYKRAIEFMKVAANLFQKNYNGEAYQCFEQIEKIQLWNQNSSEFVSYVRAVSGGSLLYPAKYTDSSQIIRDDAEDIQDEDPVFLEEDDDFNTVENVSYQAHVEMNEDLNYSCNNCGAKVSADDCSCSNCGIKFENNSQSDFTGDDFIERLYILSDVYALIVAYDLPYSSSGNRLYVSGIKPSFLLALDLKYSVDNQSIILTDDGDPMGGTIIEYLLDISKDDLLETNILKEHKEKKEMWRLKILDKVYKLISEFNLNYKVAPRMLSIQGMNKVFFQSECFREIDEDENVIIDEDDDWINIRYYGNFDEVEISDTDILAHYRDVKEGRLPF